MFGIIGNIFIVIGVIFNLLGCLGLLRFPDYYTRLQASTKSVTLGTCGILLGVFFASGFNEAGVKALLCLVFLIITTPVSAHALARAAHKSKVQLWEKTTRDEYSSDNNK